VDFQQGQFRPHRRGHGRARPKGGEARRDRGRARAGLQGQPPGDHRRRYRYRRARAARGDMRAAIASAVG
jgi:hypothetical protein